jgi:NADH/NAD ratio-sensing transcriptional regulator Rex
MEIESDILLQMLVYCRKNIASYNKMVKQWKYDYEITKDIIQRKFPTIFTENNTFDIINPKGALHITLITLDSRASEADVIDIIKLAEVELSRVGINKGDILIADRIDLKTPITKRFIDIYKY